MTAVATSEVDLLRAEVEHLRNLLTVVEACRWLDRFHSFDAIKNDTCPACGGRVVVEDNGFGTGIQLRSAA